jgi:hypothetical protein
LTVEDVDTALDSLVLSAWSSNPTLVPVENIVFGGSGAARTVTVTPVGNGSGTATITLRVSDGTLLASDTFVLTVNAVNDPPTISQITDQSMDEDRPLNPLPFTVGDVDTPLAGLILSASSSNPTLVPPDNIVFGGSAANRTLAVTPVAGSSLGTTWITLEVSDGLLSASTGFALAIHPVSATLAIAGVDVQSGLVLTLRGRLGRDYLLESSADLTAWTPLDVIHVTAEVEYFTDSHYGEQVQRFYRAKTLR